MLTTILAYDTNRSHSYDEGIKSFVLANGPQQVKYGQLRNSYAHKPPICVLVAYKVTFVDNENVRK